MRNSKLLVDENFPDKSSELKKFATLLLDNKILCIAKTKNGPLLKINGEGPRVLPPDEEFDEIREKFRDLKIFSTCFKLNYDELPNCPICGKKRKLIINGKLASTCGNPECANALRNKTNLEKYGCKCTLQNPEIRKKTINTFLREYGVDHPMKSPVIIENTKKTNLEKYGCEWSSQNEKIKEKTRISNLEKWGYVSTAQHPDVKRKCEETNKRNHGGVWNNQLASDIKKRQETSRKNHGGVLYTQTLEFRKSCGYNLYYEGEKFDSKEELAFFIYNKDLGIPIEREPLKIEYYSNGKLHYYFPDFKVADQLFEIKSRIFINEEGVWIPPIWEVNKLKRSFSDDSLGIKIRMLEDRYRAKYDAAIKNNVKILITNTPDTQIYTEYCEKKFQKKKWYLDFKIKKS